VLLFRYEVFVTSVDSAGSPIRIPNKSLIDLYMMAFRKLEAVATSNSVRLVTDSKDLSAEFQQLTNIPVGVLPIPHATGSSAGVPVEGAPPKIEGVLRVVFLGDAREEKGFRHLAPMLKGLSARSPSLPVQFVFQAFVSSSFHAPMVAEIDTLRSLRLPQLTLIERPLSIPEYNALLESADLVLLPYNSMVYTTRTSGPFVEALAHGKPVIVSENSWLSRQLGNSGAGVTFKFTDPNDFLRATLYACANFATLSDNARRFGAQYSACHNPKVFLDQLME
jgi:glycosyltransferase involved in cell wall biosynthesis